MVQFANARESLIPRKRANPWDRTLPEFWVGWYNTYGVLEDKRNREIENAVWAIHRAWRRRV